MLVSKGNAKLGPGVYHTNLSAGPPELGGSCIGATDWCRLYCYAQQGFYMMPSNQAKYAEQTALLRDDPGAYEAQLTWEVAKLRPGSVFRFATSGDIMSAEHARIIGRVVQSRPDVSFYLYTRSWQDQGVRAELTKLRKLANLTVWASTDPDTGPAPRGWRTAGVDSDTPGILCPQQAGRKASCTDCKLCWTAKDGVRLNFLTI